MKSKVRIAIALLAVMSLAICGCDIWQELPEAEYLIKKGEHRSNIRGSLPRNERNALQSQNLYFTARFDESAIYTLNKEDQYGVNKLFGFADCSTSEYKNSAAFGWNFNQATQQVDIFSSVHKGGDRMIEKLGSTNINEVLTYRLSLQGREFVFEFKDTVFKVQRESACDKGLNYLHYPYFGDHREAPQDISIYIKELL